MAIEKQFSREKVIVSRRLFNKCQPLFSPPPTYHTINRISKKPFQPKTNLLGIKFPPTKPGHKSVADFWAALQIDQYNKMQESRAAHEKKQIEEQKAIIEKNAIEKNKDMERKNEAMARRAVLNKLRDEKVMKRKIALEKRRN